MYESLKARITNFGDIGSPSDYVLRYVRRFSVRQPSSLGSVTNSSGVLPDSCRYCGRTDCSGYDCPSRPRGIFFFIDMIGKHYKVMNEHLLKPLKDTLPKLKPHVGSYRFEAANLPPFDLHRAVFHLKLASREVGKNLEMLRDTLKKHNDEVDSTEKFKENRLVDAFTNNDLSAEGGDFVLSFFDNVWRTTYVNKLNEPHALFHDVRKELLDELELCKQPSQDSKLILRYSSSSYCWEEKQQGENAKRWEAIRAVLVDDGILAKLARMEESTHKLRSEIDEIVQYVSTLSDDIENLAYEGRADCCYTNIPWLVRLFL